jgi:hypothetical protein
MVYTSAGCDFLQVTLCVESENSLLQEEILNSLGKFGSNPRYGKIGHEHANTLNWIWTSKEAGGPGFKDWLHSDQDLFWITGQPGASKSTLMKFIHDKIKKSMGTGQSGRGILLSYFLHELGIPSEKTFSGLMHALLFQLLKDLPQLIAQLHGRFQELKKRSMHSTPDESIWSQVELQGAFKDILQGGNQLTRIICIVDGIDECEERRLRHVVQFLDRLAVRNSESHLRFKLSARGVQKMRSRLPSVNILR